MIRGVAKRHDVKTAGGALSQWWTSRPLARRAVELAGVRPGMRVLDFAAGEGAISRAIVEAGAIPVAVEIDPRFIGALDAAVAPARGTVVIANFLDPDLAIGPVDVAIGNPPWERDLEVLFMLRALDFARTALGIVSGDVHHSRARFDGGWRWMRQERVEHCVPRPIWTRDGRGGGQEECDLVLVSRRTRERQPGETDRVEVSWFEHKAARR